MNVLVAKGVPAKRGEKQDVEIEKVSSTSVNRYFCSLLPMSPLRRTIQHTMKIIAVSATVGSLEALAAAMRYNIIRTISSSPVQ